VEVDREDPATDPQLLGPFGRGGDGGDGRQIV
jgi:hypothetical protein